MIRSSEARLGCLRDTVTRTQRRESRGGYIQLLCTEKRDPTIPNDYFVSPETKNGTYRFRSRNILQRVRNQYPSHRFAKSSFPSPERDLVPDRWTSTPSPRSQVSNLSLVLHLRAPIPSKPTSSHLGLPIAVISRHTTECLIPGHSSKPNCVWVAESGADETRLIGERGRTISWCIDAIRGILHNNNALTLKQAWSLFPENQYFRIR